MDRNFQRALPLVLKHEGGFVDHPNDPGGATNKGVTIATFRRYVKRNGTVADLKAITDDQVATVYYRHYWAAVQAHRLPSGVDYAVFDFAVNSGPSRAAKFLQRIVGVSADGRIGPITLEAVSRHDPLELVTVLCDARLAWLKRLKHWPTFGRGWARRVNDVKRDALAMVGNPADVYIVEKPKPTVPPEVEQQVEEKARPLEWLTGLFGVGGGAGAMVFGMPWQTAAVVLGAGLLALLILIVFRRQIIGAVKDIRAEVEGA